MALKEKGLETARERISFVPHLAEMYYEIAKDEYEKWVNLVSANKKLNEILASLDDQEEFVEVSDEQDDVN
jgi:N-acetyl-gamma-glutamylphosphate reductase